MKSKGKRILVVDDEPSIQRLLRRNLGISGYEVLVAETGEQALAMVRINQPDLILLDLWLPGEIDGMEVCRRVGKWTRGPLMVFWARTEGTQKAPWLDRGAV